MSLMNYYAVVLIGDPMLRRLPELFYCSDEVTKYYIEVKILNRKGQRKENLTYLASVTV